MDDLTITRLCARAAGQEEVGKSYPSPSSLAGCPPNAVIRVRADKGWTFYSPLHNRAQALELVERLRLSVRYDDDLRLWMASPQESDDLTTSPSLLRAICLCAARVQQAREAK